MNKYLKEVIWFCITLLLASLFLLLPIVNVHGNTIDIGIYDSYFVMDISIFFTACLIITAFIIYFIRTLILKYNNTICNIIFLVFNSAIIYVFTKLILFNNTVNGGWSIHPPVSANNGELPVVSENPLTLFLKYFQIFLILLLVFSAFRTGQKFNTQKNEK